MQIGGLILGPSPRQRGGINESASFRGCNRASLFLLVCSGEGTQHAPHMAWKLPASLSRRGVPLFVMCSLHHYSQTQPVQLRIDRIFLIFLESESEGQFVFLLHSGRRLARI